MPLAALAVCSPSYSQCSRVIRSTGHDLLYNYSLNDVIDSLPVPVSENISRLADGLDLIDALTQGQGCGNFLIWDYQVSGSGFEYHVQSKDEFIRNVAGKLSDYAKNHVFHNDASIDLSPTVGPCEPVVLLDKFNGNLGDLYVFHAGTGPYPGKKREVTFSACREITIESKTAATIELPWTVAGDIGAAESFGDPDATFCKGSLKLTASAFGQTISKEIEAESITAIPEQVAINESGSAKVTVMPGVSRYTISWSGQAKMETRAKGTGFFGLISGAANGWVAFPDTIVFKDFTGADGGPVPPNVRIYSKSASGELTYADTYPHPKVMGSVHLQGDAVRTEIPVRYRDVGGQNERFEHDGHLAGSVLTALAPDKGTFEMVIGGAPYLRRKVVVNTSAGDTSFGTIELLVGDIDGDNTITVFDYSVLSDYFDLSSSSANWTKIGPNGFAPREADLDGDGAITVFDYSYLSDNFDKSGD